MSVIEILEEEAEKGQSREESNGKKLALFDQRHEPVPPNSSYPTKDQEEKVITEAQSDC